MSHQATDSCSDDELLARVAQGDRSAFAALFRRRHQEIFRFALHLTGCPSMAQDVFLAVMRDAARYEPGRSRAVAWLCGIARNHARRRSSERTAVPLEALGDEGIGATAAAKGDPVGDLTRAEQLEALRRAVSTL